MSNQEIGYFYILSNKRNNVLYAGSTKNLLKRVKEHEKGYQNGFTKKYNVNQLIYYEIFEQVIMARNREKEVKGWKRTKKIRLIESKNKPWRDLSEELFGDPSSLRSSG